MLQDPGVFSGEYLWQMSFNSDALGSAGPVTSPMNAERVLINQCDKRSGTVLVCFQCRCLAEWLSSWERGARIVNRRTYPATVRCCVRIH